MFYGLEFGDDFPENKLPGPNNLWSVPKYTNDLCHDNYAKKLKKELNLDQMWTFTSFPSSKADPTARKVSVC